MLILDAEPAAGFYRIQSDAVLSQDRQSISSGREYDFDAMYAYISADYVSVVNTGSASGTTPDVTPEEPDTTPDVTPEEPDTTPDVTPENNGEDSSMTGAASEEQGNTDTEAADGEKTLVVKNTTPQTAVAGTAVQIKKPAPKTGDVNAAAAWIVLLAVSGTLTASVVYRKRKSC